MKWILCACLWVSLLATEARAYESDIHYSTTYVLARAVGWPEADAVTIASANEGVDENLDTVAALEVDTTSSASLSGYFASAFHQAEKNLEFHCFSRTGGQPGEIAADVRKVMARRFADVPARDDDPGSHARRLIALGAALHCQQDAYSHVSFGGSCGAYSGSCYGHTYENFVDQVMFGLLKKHYFNPDHPAVSGQRLLQALRGTVAELATRRPQASMRSIPPARLAALSDALRHSGVELPDETRRDCNRFVVGKWLFDLLHSGERTQGNPDTLETLAPEAAATCRNESLRSATVVRIPDPRFPRLRSDASPYHVRADGSYQLLHDGTLAAPMPRIATQANAGRVPDYNRRKVRLQLSHLRQLLALPFTTLAANSAGSGDSDRPRVVRTSRWSACE